MSETPRTDAMVRSAGPCHPDYIIIPVAYCRELERELSRLRFELDRRGGEALYVIFDGPPGPDAGRFVEVETANGKSVSLPTCEWEDYNDGYCRLGPLYTHPSPPAEPIAQNEGEKIRAAEEDIERFAVPIAERVSDEESKDALASRLIDVWIAEKGKKIPWAKAIQIIAIVTKQPDEERDHLLRMADDDDGKCEMCGRSDPSTPRPPVDQDGKRYRDYANRLREFIESVEWNSKLPHDVWAICQHWNNNEAIDAAMKEPK